MIYQFKKIFLFTFIFVVLFISSKIIVNNNFQILKNNKHESFFIFYNKLNENYKLQLSNIKNDNLCENIKNKKIDRHHLRWVFEGFRISLLEMIYSKFKSKKLLNYFFSFSIFLILLISFLFSLMTSSLLSNKKLNSLNEKNILISFFVYVFLLSLYSFREVSEIRFSFYEMLFLSAGIYFAVKKYFFLYLITCIFAVLNRESGIISTSLWFIFNFDFLKQKKILSKINIKNFMISFFTFVLTLFALVIVNKEIFSCGFQPQLFMHVDVQDTRVFEQNLFSFRVINSFITNFLLVFFFIIFYWYENKNQLKIILLVLIYSFIFLFFTPIDHYILRIIFIPFITIYICNYLFHSEEFKKNI